MLCFRTLEFNKKLQNIEEKMSQVNPSSLQAINNSPLNRSVSKAMFSFTKSNRFSPQKDNNASFYEKSSTLHQRTTSFGFGNKSQLTNKYNFSPSPDKYDLKSDFQPSPKKGISIGQGRQNCKNVSIFTYNNYPSAATYLVKDKQNVQVHKIRERVKLPELFPDRKTPGPGQYCISQSQKHGLTTNSKFKSSICYKIHDQSPNKIEKAFSPSLGPQSYNTSLPSTGKQILSKKKTQKSFYFDKKPRKTFVTESLAPGPGAYKIFSQFNR